MTRPLIALLGILLLCGCTRLQTVTVPASTSTVNVTTPDTLELGELPPLEPRGSLTMPEEVVIFRDTPEVTVDLSWLEVDRTDVDEQTVRVRTKRDSQTVERRYQLPAVGEGLRLVPDSAEALRGSVFGTPQDYEVEADVSEREPSWWKKAWRSLQLMLAFVAGAFAGYMATKVVPG